MVYVSAFEGKGKVRRQMIDEGLNLDNARLVTAMASSEDAVSMQEMKFARDYLNAAGFGTADIVVSPYSFLLGHKGFYIYPPEKRAAKSKTSDAQNFANSFSRVGYIF